MSYSNSSTIYTMGTALSRAEQLGVRVEVLVGGQWLAGYIVANDGVGLVLNSDGEEHSVVRIESIFAVRVLTPAPMAQPMPQPKSQPLVPAPQARPMPRPRSA